MKPVSLLAVALLATTATALMNLADFKKNILPICYNRTEDKRSELTAGQPEPMANSIETFLSLVERLEFGNTFSTAEDLVEYLLVRYRIDDLSYTPPTASTPGGMAVKEKHGKMQKLMKQLLDVGSRYKESLDDFSDSERCSLFYMLSQTVNDTARDGDPVQNGPQYSTGRSSGEVGYKQAANPREQGVVSLRSKERHAIALGHVLQGILAGLKKPGNETLLAVFNRLKKGTEVNDNLIDGNTKFNYVYAATLSELFSATILVHKEASKGVDTEVQFGPNGVWNSSLCTTEYGLDNVFSGYATYSMFRGAVDGLLLGLRADDLRRGVRLSQLLRMYYSKGGIPDSASPLSFCSRRDVVKGLQSEVRSQATSYGRLYSALYSDLYDNRDDASTFTDNIVNKFYGSTISSDIFDGVYEDGDCDGVTPAFTNPECETPNDVFFVLDARNKVQDNFLKEREVVSKVTSGLDLRTGGSSVTVLANVAGARREEMYCVVSNSTSGGCPGCKTAWFSSGGRSPLDEATAMRSLNASLMTFEMDRATLPGVPGKVVVYFNYGDARNEQSLRDAVDLLHKRHRDVPVLALGLNRQWLALFVRDSSKDVITGVDDSSEVARRLLDRTCKTPATLQYADCWTPSDYDSDYYTGYVTPNHVQYWAMFPEYFLKSFTINFKFTSQGGSIRVCFDRSYKKLVEDKTSGTTCKDTSDSVASVDFTIRNPCKKRTVDNCDPFYFAVIGKESTSGNGNPQKPTCQDRTCKSTDQIVFTVSHKGVGCSGSGTLLASFLLTFLLALFSVSE